jgi:hypothetical protein
VGACLDARVPYQRGPEEVWLLPAARPRLAPPSASPRPWASLRPAAPDMMVLARCWKNNSWLRGRVLSLGPEGVTVLYVDCGRVELHREASRLADLPALLAQAPGAVRCVLEGAPCSWGREARRGLARRAADRALAWRLLVLGRAGPALLVRLIPHSGAIPGCRICLGWRNAYRKTPDHRLLPDPPSISAQNN